MNVKPPLNAIATRRTPKQGHGAIVAAGEARGTVALWRVADRSIIHACYAHPGPVFALAFAPDEQHLLSGGLDGAIRVWQAPDRRETGGDLPPISAMAEPPGERSAALFRKCSDLAAPTSTSGSAKAGPALYGMFGRRAGAVPGKPP